MNRHVLIYREVTPRCLDELSSSWYQSSTSASVSCFASLPLRCYLFFPSPSSPSSENDWTRGVAFFREPTWGSFRNVPSSYMEPLAMMKRGGAWAHPKGMEGLSYGSKILQREIWFANCIDGVGGYMYGWWVWVANFMAGGGGAWTTGAIDLSKIVYSLELTRIRAAYLKDSSYWPLSPTKKSCLPFLLGFWRKVPSASRPLAAMVQ